MTWNRGAERLFGYTAAEMLGQSPFVLTPEAKRAEALELKARCPRGRGCSPLRDRARGEERRRFWRCRSPFLPARRTRKHRAGRAAVVRDITDRKSAERRLQRLSWRLLRIQDEERRRLARDLHDSTAQSLAALAMNLSVLRAGRPAALGSAAPGVAGRFGGARRAGDQRTAHDLVSAPSAVAR